MFGAMSSPMSVVEAYYAAYRAPNVAEALGEVLHAEVIVDSPIVQARYGGPLSGEAALKAAAGVAAFLKNAVIEATYVSTDGRGAVALIHFPTPVGELFQSEHFDVEDGRVKRLRSFYDPRKLLPPG
jgi:hypothetical protein